MRRRDLLKKLAAGVGLTILSPWAKGAPPSDQIVTGHIGVGQMGRQGHVAWFLSNRDLRIAAVADVDGEHRANALSAVHHHYANTEAMGYLDFRDLLDRRDIDVITCATPDHWHALVTILAFQAGKDVYCEKPLCHNFREAQRMETAARRYARVFQLGTQVHAGENYRRVVELIRSGVIGRIHCVRAWRNGTFDPIQEPGPQTVPSAFDYNMWLGPAPWRPYHPDHTHYRFRFFLDFSCGHYADFWCHINDIAFWALDLGAPLTIASRGQFPAEGVADAPQWIDVDYDFPGLKYHWTTQPPNVAQVSGKPFGCLFEGTDGSLFCDYYSRRLFLGHESFHDIPSVPRTLPRPSAHPRTFLNCVRSRKLTDTNLPYAVNLTAPMFFGRISLLLGRSLRWDAEGKQFMGDEEANRLLGRPCREPWVIPD